MRRHITSSLKNQNANINNVSKSTQGSALSAQASKKRKTDNKSDINSLTTKIDLITLEKNLEIKFTKEASQTRIELSDKISKSQITMLLWMTGLIVGSMIANKFL